MRFRPSLGATMALATLGLIFLGLGLWQQGRKAEKQDLFDRFENAPRMGIEQALAEGTELTRVYASGRYDPRRHLLQDNRIWKSRAGVHVLTPFTLADGRVLLVNRGWLPMPADRRSLPRFETDPGLRSIEGRLVSPASGGPRLGSPDVLDRASWPQLVTYLDLGTASEALQTELLPWILQLDAADASGFEDREWQAAVMGPAVHGAYAVQWFALLGTTVVIWLVLAVRGGRTPGRI